MLSCEPQKSQEILPNSIPKFMKLINNSTHCGDQDFSVGGSHDSEQ
jgi:hypothetical protein